MLDLSRGAWEVVRELAEETGFGVGQVLYPHTDRRRYRGAIGGH